MVSKLCCLGPLFKQQGKYYPRKNEQRAIEQLEQMTWQDSQHDEAEYPYEWLKSASTRKHRSSRGRRRRFLSRIRTVHAVGDTEIPEDFIFNSVVANEDLSCKESDVTESAVDPGVPEGRNDVTKGQKTNISSALTDAADAKEPSPPTSLTEEEKKQKRKESKCEKDIPSSSQKLGGVTKDNTELLEIEQRCADTTAQSPPSSSATCSASPSANNPIANTQKDTSCDQDASKDHQAHQQAEENIEDDGRDEEQLDVAEVLITPENVRDYLRLDEDRHEERMRDLTRGNRSTAPCGQPLEQSIRPLDWYIHQALQRQNQVQRQNNQSLLLDNGQIVYHVPTTHRPQPHVSLGLLQQPHQRSHPDHRVRQLSDIEQIQRTLHQYHTQRRSRADEAEQGDRRHERRGQRRQQYLLQRLDLGGEVGTARNNAERMRENIVRELRQQAHRPDQREGYVSRVMAMVRQRHSQQEQNGDDPSGSPLNNVPPDLERRVRPAEIDRTQRLNPHPPRRRRRCQKHYKGTVFQPKKE